MAANNHYNFGGHPSVSANSGLKPSSGESLYTNGSLSSMSFSQQGKNLNGDLNVNGITTVAGSGAPGAHPSTSYSHMSNHHQPHQSSLGYDYLWGQSQYRPALSAGHRASMHHKQSPGAALQLPQHFQGHAQYQANGGLVGPRQPPATAAPNVSLAGGQYWNRGSPSQQHGGSPLGVAYNSHGGYGAYQGQGHPGMAPVQHHQQQHQPQQHLHHHQQQQQHHYGMVPNGMSYYQPHCQPPPTAQVPPQAQVMPPASQNYALAHHSPQHHSMSRGATGSPLPMQASTVPMMPSANIRENGGPQQRDRPSGHCGSQPIGSQGGLSELYKDVDSSYNLLESVSVSQHLPKTEGFTQKTTTPSTEASESDFSQGAQHLPADTGRHMVKQYKEGDTGREPASSVGPAAPGGPGPSVAPATPLAPSIAPAPLTTPTSPRVHTPPVISSPPVVPTRQAIHTPPTVSVPPLAPTISPAYPVSPSPSLTLTVTARPVASSTAPTSPVAHTMAPTPPMAPASQTVPIPPMAPASQTVPTPPVAPASQTVPTPPVAPASQTVPTPPLAPPSQTVPTPPLAPAPQKVHSPPLDPAPQTVHTPSLALAPSGMHTAPAGPALSVATSTTQWPPAPLPVLSVSPVVPKEAGSEEPAFSAFTTKLELPMAGGPEAVKLGLVQNVVDVVVVHKHDQGLNSPISVVQLSETSHLLGGLSDVELHADKSLDAARVGGLPNDCEGDLLPTGSSHVNASKVEESSALGNTLSSTSHTEDLSVEDQWATQISEEADETQDEDIPEMVDLSSATEDSLMEPSLDHSSLPMKSFNKASQSAMSLSSTSDNAMSFQSSTSDSNIIQDCGVQDGPISSGGDTAVLHVEEQVVEAEYDPREQSVNDTVQASLSPPPSRAVTPNTGRRAERPRTLGAKLPFSHERKRSRVSKPSPKTGKGAIAKLEKVGDGEERKRVAGMKGSVESASLVAGLSTTRKEPISLSPEPCSSHCLSVPPQKPLKVKRAKKGPGKVPHAPKVEVPVAEDEDEKASANGEVQKRHIATEEQVRFPLLHGWRREVRVRKCENRMKGETWYYSPCGKRMKQFPEIIKYLSRHPGTAVSREHFSFSPRTPVGDFYEERETPQGVEWFLLANEEVPSMIMTITGRRGRPPNPDRMQPRHRPRAPRKEGGRGRRPGRPPKVKTVDMLSKMEAKLLKKLESQETLSEEDKEKLNKIKKKMKKKTRNKRKEDTKNKKIRQERRKVKSEKAKEAKEEEERGGSPEHSAPKPMPDPRKPGRRKRVKVLEKADEKAKLEKLKRGCGARSKAKALARAQAEAEAHAQAVEAARRQVERRAQAQRRLQERKRQQLLLEELKKPTEDMCITDHQPLPEFFRVPGLVLSGTAFSHCLMVVEFLHSYGKVLGLQLPQDVPSLSTLQEGLLGVGDSQGEVQDLLVRLVKAALHDPGLPPHYQTVKILGEKLVDLELNRSSVTEALRIFLEARGFEPDVCNSLRTKPFQALSPDSKAAVLAFLTDELNASNIIISEIDKTLENMAVYRKNKWDIEGKLRRLKAALVRRTGRSEAELCLEERRRSARVAEEESLSLEEGSQLDRGVRRARREEGKLSEGESPSSASIPELERQIDKLTKRQVFFCKKLLQCSHIMRGLSLGQDRYRRRYWVLPHIGGILVEGAEEVLGSGDRLVKEEEPQSVTASFISPVKTEPTVDPLVSPPAAAAQPPLSSPLPPQEDDPLPGTASLMSSPRGRGRPRKIKPEVELHLRTAKNRRRRRSSKAGGEESANNSLAIQNGYDLAQSAFLAWLSQSQGSVTDGLSRVCSQEDESGQQDSMKEMAEKQGQWFNLLPKTPCDPSSLSQSHLSSSPSKEQIRSRGVLSTPLPLWSGLLLSTPALCPQVCSTSLQKLDGRQRWHSGQGLTTADPSFLGFSIPPAAKRRGRPPSKLLQEIEQKYFTQLIPRPIPSKMVQGWWWIRAPEELTALVQVLHPRGIREKALHRHLSKHSEYLADICSVPKNDPVFQERVEQDQALSQVAQQPWEELAWAMEADMTVLQWVEDLEQRVLTADLQLKKVPQMGRSNTDDSMETTAPETQGFTAPKPDSIRADLEYHDHVVDPQDDWTVKTKREWSGFLRLPNNPLDLAVMRLVALERSIERRYLKEPLWNLAEVVRLAPLTLPPGGETLLDADGVESEITPRLRLWRQALDRCRSSAQLSLCLLQLERSIAWERSVVKVTCLVCKKGDNDEYLLLCDGCDRGCHMYCLRPKITEIPEGDWFCPVCVPEVNRESQRPRRLPRPRSAARKRRYGGYGSGSSDEEHSPRRGGMTTRQRDSPAMPSHARFSGEGSSSGYSPSKRRRMATRNQPDLTFCEIILMEMEAHADAWPFLEPVNPRMVPGYRRIIKHPMDFLTMRERLLQGGYCSCEDFAADAQLVFDNCQLFNEDTSEVGVAGHSMRRFFESRWAEFYQDKDQ
ncbi:bromodomain adjacent to zinc finger domain protein 2A-like isoform X2 [Megalops cyprinoides]|uniref:bromodomain adjacent to zinc finger domain protein 2A-like isoform X2 n=1 Tax=Megalops cyprinoides TaxID=118141 RepID=UPI0018654C6D|nr:bromodomain adjacent to zinc finger domain protein 2A-like isoform X2 [Megalops cyprinoides]